MKVKIKIHQRWVFNLFLYQRWGAANPDWIAICYNESLEILRV